MLLNGTPEYIIFSKTFVLTRLQKLLFENLDIDSSQLPAATYGCTTAAQPSHVTPLRMAACDGQTEQNAESHGYVKT